MLHGTKKRKRWYPNPDRTPRMQNSTIQAIATNWRSVHLFRELTTILALDLRISRRR